MLLQVALLLLDLQLGECGQQALQAAGAGQGNEEVPGLELALCCSRAASLVGDDTGSWLLSGCMLCISRFSKDQFNRLKALAWSLLTSASSLSILSNKMLSRTPDKPEFPRNKVSQPSLHAIGIQSTAIFPITGRAKRFGSVTISQCTSSIFPARACSNLSLFNTNDS